MALALPLLLLSWVQLTSGIYHLASAVVVPTAPSDYGEWAAWEFTFSFGVASVAVLIASRVQFLSRVWVRKTFLYSLVASSVLFTVPFAVGALFSLIHKWG
jgi:hypothetical protein